MHLVVGVEAARQFGREKGGRTSDTVSDTLEAWHDTWLSIPVPLIQLPMDT